MKKTVLDDDACIYQKREEESEKQKWGRMNGKQKMQYFLDYYLLKIAVGLMLAALAGYLVWSFLRPKDTTALYVAVVDEQLDEEKKGELEWELEELYQIDGKRQKVVIDDLFYMQDGALDKLQVLLFNHQIDVIIAEEETCKRFDGYGYLQNMDEILDEDERQNYGMQLSYGVSLQKSRRFGTLQNYLKEPVFAIVMEAPHTERALEFLDYLMER